jgi:hypothetical protein
LPGGVNEFRGGLARRTAPAALHCIFIVSIVVAPAPAAVTAPSFPVTV